MVVGPGERVAFDVEVAKLEGVGLGAVLLRHRLVNQLLVRFPEVGGVDFLVSAELFDRWREMQQRAEFQQPVRRVLRRRDAMGRHLSDGRRVVSTARDLSAVLFISGHHEQGKQMPQRIDRQMDLAAFPAFGSVIAGAPPALGRRLQSPATNDCGSRALKSLPHRAIFAVVCHTSLTLFNTVGRSKAADRGSCPPESHRLCSATLNQYILLSINFNRKR